jgi:CHASE3 domain sensor protein
MSELSELKALLDERLKNMADQLSTLSQLVRAQDGAIQRIELTVTTSITSLQKDMGVAFDKIREIWTAAETEENSRVASDISLGTRIAGIENQFNAYKQEQLVENSKNKSTRTVLAIIVGIVLPILIGFLWELLIKGGVAGITL